ncbi:MAG: S-methyl-5'-thioadenosine phosphorylase [Nanoarchaeota archaeon]|nr:S-methyl-5'-thioadenosine phosphorylase [Nanoarchaeota archaeon]
MVKIGIIGGSGLEDPQLLKDAQQLDVDTPYGKPSSPLTTGKINDVEVVIISRHGTKHQIMPTNVPNQANIHALKEQQVTHILATSACGSLRQDVAPGDFVIVDQFIDRTTKRPSTFYEKDHVCHLPMANPFCNHLRANFKQACESLNYKAESKGTVITIEGPRLSTKAESHLWRQWKADVINMSTVPECVLAREKGICYSVICMATDYDAFIDGQEANVTDIMKVFKDNAQRVKEVLRKAVTLVTDKECTCKTDINTSVIS